MKNIVFILSFFICWLYSYEDFGVHGKLYDIKEKNMKELLKNELKKLDKKKLEQNVRSGINRYMAPKSNLPHSQATTKFTKENYIIITQDRPMPDGSVLKAGSKIYANLPLGKKVSICFVDGSDIKLLKEVVDTFDKCIYMVANESVLKLQKHPVFKSNQVYPQTGMYAKKFDIKVLPTKLTFYTKYVDYESLDMNKIKERVYVKVTN